MKPCFFRHGKLTRSLFWIAGIVAVFCLGGCQINPVTGKKELVLVPQSVEWAVGASNYAPLQQASGGPYTTYPEVNDYVRQVGHKLSEVSDRPDLPYEFVVLNHSIPNAWALPSGKIAIHRGLLTELEDEAQLAAVLSHEIVHAAARHSAKNMQRQIILQLGVAATVTLIGGAADSELAGQTASMLGNAASSLFQFGYSRRDELEADYYGLQYMARANYDPVAAVELQQKFVALEDKQESSWLAGMLRTHPPSMERVEANRETAGQLHITKPYRGRDAFQRAMRKLLKDRSAYAHYDQASEAYRQKQPDKALHEIQRAITLQPQEAEFYRLRGDLFFQNEDIRKAKRDYERALSLQDQYYLHHQRLGVAFQSLGQTEQAIRYLESSIKLLPSDPAYFSLGELGVATGDREQAVHWFSLAAQSSDARIARAATDWLQKLGALE